MVNNPLIRPYFFWGGVAVQGAPLDSHDKSFQSSNAPTPIRQLRPQREDVSCWLMAVGHGYASKSSSPS